MRIVIIAVAIIFIFIALFIIKSAGFKRNTNGGIIKSTVKKNVTCSYNEEMGGIIANIIGNLDSSDIDEFSRNLLGTIEKYTPDKKFTLLLNGNGYFPKSLFVHRKYGSFLKSNEVLINYCKAVGHVHHDSAHIDEWKPTMNEYQGFFYTFDEAFAWLKTRK
jgi:hypothetical protein